MMNVRFLLSLRNVEDLLHKRGIDKSHEAIRYWWKADTISRKTVPPLEMNGVNFARRTPYPNLEFGDQFVFV